MTLAITRALEKRIRAHPGQWFWIHRRWKGGTL
jgi:Kdo2-lipid IVA lauroyltransferase/acyltransferase